MKENTKKPDIPSLNLSPFIAGYMRLNEWGMSPQELLGFIEAHLDLGVTSVDHADIYGDYQEEQLFGRALQLKPDLRQRLQLVSKCGIQLLSTNRPENRVKHYNTSRAHIIKSVENSLKNLHTDYLDLLLIHRPDPLMDLDEVALAFETLCDQGKVLHVGVSNFNPAQFELLQSRLSMPLVTNQIEFSPFNLTVLEDGTLDYCQRLRLSPMIWAPLGGGRLFAGDDPRSQAVRSTLERLAENYDAAGIDQLVLAWVMRHPSRPKPILGSRNLQRIASAVAAQNIELDRQDWFDILHAATGRDVP